MQTVYEMKDDVWGYLLVKLVFEIDFEKLRYMMLKNQFFEVLNGLSMEIREKKLKSKI